jgi:transposase
MEAMAPPRKYPDELRERAIRFALDLVEGPEKLSVNAACKGVVSSWGSCRTRYGTGCSRPASTTAPPGLTTDERARMSELERENVAPA